MYCDKINNVSLSAFDDKRYWLSDGISSYAFGHSRFRSLKTIHSDGIYILVVNQMCLL